MPSTAPESPTAGLHLHRWTDRAVVAVAIAAFASGFAQFGVVAALGSVAQGFGQVTSGMDVVDQIAKAQLGGKGPFPPDATPIQPVTITRVTVSQ